MDTLRILCESIRVFLKIIFKTFWMIWAFPYRVIFRFSKWFFVENKNAAIVLKVLPGLLIVLFLHHLEFTQWGEGILNNTFDRFIHMEAQNSVQTNADMGDILLVDIGHRVKEREKERNEIPEINHLSPRDTIARLLEMAFIGRAKIVVLDFFFDEYDCCYPHRDAQLRKVLAANTTQTKVIFPVKIGQKKELRSLIFDAEIDNNPNYFRAIPTILASQSDCIVRYWKAYQKYGNKDDRVLWSIPILTAALYAGEMEEIMNIEQKLIEGEGKTGFYSIDINQYNEGSVKFLLPIGEHDLYLQRIRYRLIPKDCIADHPEGNLILPTIEYLTPERFKNKIVIIGNSHLTMGDSHITPVGNMPGMYIHGNTVHNLLKGIQFQRLPWWITVFINTFIIVVAAYILHKLDSFLASILGIVLGISIFLFVKYVCFLWALNILSDFSLGIAGIGIMESIYSLRDKIAKKR